MGKPTRRRGARGRGSHPRTREALGARPRPLGGAAFNGWTGGDEGRRKLPGCDRAARLGQSQPGSAGPGTEIAASGAPDGERADRKARAARKADSQYSAPFGAPSPHCRGEPLISKRGRGTRACPGPTKEHGRCRASIPLSFRGAPKARARNPYSAAELMRTVDVITSIFRQTPAAEYGFRIRRSRGAPE